MKPLLAFLTIQTRKPEIAKYLGVIAIALGIFSAPVGNAQAHDLQVLFEDKNLSITKTLDELIDLPVTHYKTATVWTDSVDLYSGVLLHDLLHYFDVDLRSPTGSVTLEAIDGYSATINFTQIASTAPLLAFHRNHKPMPVRTQGPFWLIFNFDADVQYRTETLYALSVWQVQRLVIRL